MSLTGDSVIVAIELCGRLADGPGREVTLALPQDGCTAKALLDLAAQRHPALAEAIGGGRVKVCADERLLAPHDHVAADARIALFPPVSGG